MNWRAAVTAGLSPSRVPRLDKLVMNSNTASISNYASELVSLAARTLGNAKPWVRSLRDDAARQFAELGFPSARHEDWKYTNVAPLEKAGFKPATAGLNGATRDQVQSVGFADLAAYRLVFVNGHYSPALSAPGDLPKGLRIASIADTLHGAPDLLAGHLGHYVTPRTTNFAMLNTAFLADGAYIHIDKGTTIAHPVHLVFLTTPEGESLLIQPRNLVIAEEGSSATIVEQYATIGTARYFTNAVTEVTVGPGAKIEHYRLQQESTAAYHIGGLYVQQNHDSRFASHAFDLGGLLVRNDLVNTLAAEGAECVLNGLYIVDGRGHVDNHTHVDHLKPHGTSREFYKGVLDGRARAVFNGRVVVHANAQQTDAQQMNNNLLLSRDAEVDTKPQLEIYADDVKCSHGATVGQLDEDSLFYLRARGVDEAAARDLLTFAFANDILARIGLAPIRRQLEEQLTVKLLRGRRLEARDFL